MKCNRIAFLIVMTVLITGCRYSLETDNTLDTYLDIAKKIEWSNIFVHAQNDVSYSFSR